MAEYNLKEKRIFVSYGHDKYSIVAKRLVEDLTPYCEHIWFDSKNIREFHGWTDEIEDGIKECDIVLALMTKHAYRRPSGVCINEIIFANNNSKVICPILVEKMEVPLLLCSIQYFDINEFYNSTTKTFTTRTHYGSGDPTVPGIYDDNFYRDNQEYFYIVFEYTYNGSTYTDFTFFQYTKYQLEDIVKYEDGKLEIAVGRLTNTASKDDGVYAINTDYSLTANQDYQYEKYLLEDYKDSRNRYLWISIISGVVLAGIIGGVVFYLVKQYKTAQKKADAEIQKTEAETKLAEEKAKQINRTCEYCGASVPDGDETCPGCGSRFFE